MSFTNEEYVDIVVVYGFCDYNAAESRREYSRRYPNRRLPNERTFVNVHRCLREFGKFPTNNRLVGNVIQDIGVEEAILNRFERDPRTSTRTVSREFGVSQSYVSRLVRKENLHPYHFIRVQALEPRDPPLRVQFCRLIRQLDRSDFLKTILWTDESTFTRDGVFNIHNEHYYAAENPHLVHECSHQVRFKVNVWIGLIGSRLIGPYLDLPIALNGIQYLDFLTETLPLLFQDLPLDLRQRIVFQADGAPPHFNVEVRNHIRNTFNMWIGRGGTIAWPPRSPDLTPLDYYVWGHLKQNVYRTPVLNVEELRNRILTACEILRDELNLKATVREFRKRLRKCIRVNGGHFEHLLK